MSLNFPASTSANACSRGTSNSNARIVAGARSSHSERHIIIISELIEEMARIGTFIAPTSVIRAAHVSAGADALRRPAVPLLVGIKADRNDGGCRSRSRHSRK